ncbi:MAG: hypothetical protein HW374_1161, partial [Bacteroidetes bacterium]|nr:hypothetical protein [Bacteroidota bacterium]
MMKACSGHNIAKKKLPPKGQPLLGSRMFLLLESELKR